MAFNKFLETAFPHVPQANTNFDVGKMLFVSVELGLLLVVIHLFGVQEDFGLLKITPVIFFGFVIHAVLPLRYRMPFFLSLSLAAIMIVLGFKQGSGLIVLGLGLITICHLPIPLRARVGLLISTGLILGALRTGWLTSFWDQLPTLVLPILGSMFMFRLAIYLYDLSHQQQPASIWERLSYFFMFPNLFFLLFPVIDYQTFRKSYYSDDPTSVYQKGLLWMFRGITHLLLYRIIYHHLLPSPAAVTDLGGVVLSFVSTYMVILRLSGQFHLVIGMMCLFGFNLPETLHLYFLASGFNDYWRRVNIYWKDFMMKLFYYPSYLWLRRWGMIPGLVFATIVVFVATWVLHSYQWFWITGTFPIKITDVLFWGILGVLVTMNTVYEAKWGRQRAIGRQAWRRSSAAVHVLKIIGMFALISVLWAMWSSGNIHEFFSMLRVAGSSSLASWALLAASIFLMVALGVIIHFLASQKISFTLSGPSPEFKRAAITTSLGAVFLIAAGSPAVYTGLGTRYDTFVSSLKDERLNRQDAETMERGYYEGLLNPEMFTSALWMANARKPADWKTIRQSEISRDTGTIIEWELVPSILGEYNRALFQTNRWGMRDVEYQLDKPDGFHRIALLGSSNEMGRGVRNDQIFETLAEEKLNRRHVSAPNEHYEILNFAVDGYSVDVFVAILDSKILRFQPDLLLVAGHTADDRRLKEHLRRIIRTGMSIPYSELQEIIDKSGAVKSMTDSEIDRRLRTVLEEITRWGYRTIVDVCIKNGIKPVWVYVPSTDENWLADSKSSRDDLLQLAENEGFTILNLSGAYSNHTLPELRVAPWDGHPNAFAHSLLADRLYRVLLENDQALGLGLSGAAATHAEPVAAQTQHE